MKKFGLIGHPIEHSTSPAVFSAGYKDKPYTYDLIEGEDFEESYRRFIESYDGINVTAPFKELAFARANLHSPECEIIGATNLLIKTPEGVKAYNTDYYGIIFSILLGFGVNVKNFSATPSAEECRAALDGTGSPASKVKVDGIGSTGETEREQAGKPRKALVVGCGGAGKAAATAAVSLGFDTTLMNRTIDKALAFAERINPEIERAKKESARRSAYEIEEIPTAPVGRLTVRPIDDFAECLEQNELIIYTLPCPIDALEEIEYNTAANMAALDEMYPISYPPKVFIEANYRDPAFTPELIKKIQTHFPEPEIIRGNVWHLYQAWSGYILFTGETPDLAAMAEVDK